MADETDPKTSNKITEKLVSDNTSPANYTDPANVDSDSNNDRHHQIEMFPGNNEPENDESNATNTNDTNPNQTQKDEFYTAKDFPVQSRYSKKDEVHHLRDAIPIPYGADQPYEHSRAYSQGFVIELNDMPGKPKSVSTYDYSSKGNLTASNRKTHIE